MKGYGLKAGQAFVQCRQGDVPIEPGSVILLDPEKGGLERIHNATGVWIPIDADIIDNLGEMQQKLTLKTAALDEASAQLGEAKLEIDRLKGINEAQGLRIAGLEAAVAASSEGAAKVTPISTGTPSGTPSGAADAGDGSGTVGETTKDKKGKVEKA